MCDKNQHLQKNTSVSSCNNILNRFQFFISLSKTFYRRVAEHWIGGHDTMTFFDIRVSSSYGPFGRSKILLAHAGVVLVTKDCNQLLQYTSNTDSLSKLLLSIVKKHTDVYGDGGMTLALLMSSCISTFDSVLSKQENHVMRYRLKTLHSVETILSLLHKNKDRIQHHLVDSGLWVMSDINMKSMCLVCNHILHPTSNSQVAHNISNIMVS
jgi:hypothetical protein